jgi:hypothetical protein
MVTKAEGCKAGLNSGEFAARIMPNDKPERRADFCNSDLCRVFTSLAAMAQGIDRLVV